MHGTSGQYRIDMKRDDPRTLMLKMDARLTYAGRERHVALQLEGERQMKHIEWGRQLSQAEFKRQEKDVRRRMKFFQSIIEENKLMQRTSTTEMNIFETEIQAKKTRRRLPPVRRKKTNLNLAERTVGSVRREQQYFTHNRAHERFLNRGLNDLNNSYKKHQSQKEINEAKLSKIREELATIGRAKPSETNQLLPQLQQSDHEPNFSKSKRKSHHQTLSLPELPKAKEEQMIPRDQKLSISHKILSSDDLGKLPGITVTEDGRTSGNQSRLSDKFYINTSHSQTVGRRRCDSIQLITLNNPKSLSKKKNRNVHSPKLPVSLHLPSHFYEGIYEENPFLTPDFKPQAIRNKKESKKGDDMFAWLGLDSLEELHSLRGGDIIGIGKEGDNDMAWVEIESASDVMSNPDTALPAKPDDARKAGKKRVYRIGGSIDLDQAKNKFNPLEKFTSAARTLMIIRKMQDEAGCIPEEDNAPGPTETKEPAEDEVAMEDVEDEDKTEQVVEKIEANGEIFVHVD